MRRQLEGSAVLEGKSPTSCGSYGDEEPFSVVVGAPPRKRQRDDWSWEGATPSASPTGSASGNAESALAEMMRLCRAAFPDVGDPLRAWARASEPANLSDKLYEAVVAFDAEAWVREELATLSHLGPQEAAAAVFHSEDAATRAAAQWANTAPAMVAAGEAAIAAVTALLRANGLVMPNLAQPVQTGPHSPIEGEYWSSRSATHLPGRIVGELQDVARNCFTRCAAPAQITSELSAPCRDWFARRRYVVGLFRKQCPPNDPSWVQWGWQMSQVREFMAAPFGVEQRAGAGALEALIPLAARRRAVITQACRAASSGAPQGSAERLAGWMSQLPVARQYIEFDFACDFMMEDGEKEIQSWVRGVVERRACALMAFREHALAGPDLAWAWAHATTRKYVEDSVIPEQVAWNNSIQHVINGWAAIAAHDRRMEHFRARYQPYVEGAPNQELVCHARELGVAGRRSFNLSEFLSRAFAAVPKHVSPSEAASLVFSKDCMDGAVFREWRQDCESRCSVVRSLAANLATYMASLGLDPPVLDIQSSVSPAAISLTPTCAGMWSIKLQRTLVSVLDGQGCMGVLPRILAELRGYRLRLDALARRFRTETGYELVATCDDRILRAFLYESGDIGGEQSADPFSVLPSKACRLVTSFLDDGSVAAFVMAARSAGGSIACDRLVAPLFAAPPHPVELADSGARNSTSVAV